MMIELKLGQSLVMQESNDPNHSTTSTSEWLKKNKIEVLQ